MHIHLPAWFNNSPQLFWIWIITGVGLTLLVLASNTYFPDTASPDWTEHLRQSVLLLLSGESPCQMEVFYNPPWKLIPLIPFAQLSPKVGGYTSGRVRKAGRSG
jgi:hypothetical protein